MIVGLFLRNYRSYRATHFVPISQNGDYLSIFIGPNGVGKSTVLDALEKFFNGGDWSVNVTAKRSGGLSSDDKVPFIAPVLMLMPGDVSGELKESIEKLDLAIDSAKSNSPASKSFEKFRQRLKRDNPGAYVIVLGRALGDQGRVFLGPYEKDPEIRKAFGLSVDEHFSKELSSVIKFVLDSYAYFYIPVETDPQTYTKLEQLGIQKLLDEDIQGQIEKIITSATLANINRELAKFLEDIHQHLENYAYKNHYKERLTMRDLVAKVIEAFFSTKVLHKDGAVPVAALSAGEKRLALIDVAYSFLNRSRDRNVRVVLAIDEPDASLHASACHDQFSKLASIVDVTTPQTQVLITTHWYGFLPLASRGEAQSMTEQSGELSVATIDLRSYREAVKDLKRTSRGSLPVDVAVKSYNDLVQTIVGAVVRKDNPYTWIICEGLSDKMYLEHYLGRQVLEGRLRILPMGGAVDVKRIYDRLVAPLADDAYEVFGRVLCLVDTDSEAIEFDVRSVDKLFFKRMVLKDGDVALVEANSVVRAPVTAVEDALEPTAFYETLKELASSDHPLSTELSALIESNPLQAAAKVSANCMDMRTSHRNLLADLLKTGDRKVDFAERYCRRADATIPPTWVLEVSELLWPQNRPRRRVSRAAVAHA